jgi:hypothetical protein
LFGILCTCVSHLSIMCFHLKNVKPLFFLFCICESILWNSLLPKTLTLDNDNCMEKTKTLKLLGDWLFAEILLTGSKCWCKTLQRKRTEMLTMLLLPGVDNNEFWSKQMIKNSVAHFTKCRCKFSLSHHHSFSPYTQHLFNRYIYMCFTAVGKWQTNTHDHRAIVGWLN